MSYQIKGADIQTTHIKILNQAKNEYFSVFLKTDDI